MEQNIEQEGMTRDIEQAKELAQIAMCLQRRFLRRLSSGNPEQRISVTQFAVLSFLGAKGMCTMSEIARWMNHTMAAANGLVNRLCESGWTERSTLPDDRRCVGVRLTASGHEMVARVQQGVTDNILDIFRVICQEDREAWLRVYRKINEVCQQTYEL